VLKSLRGGAAASGVAVVLSLSLAAPAHANPIVAPVMPAAAGAVSTAAGAICGTGVGCVVLAGVALASGAYWAYNNQDKLVEWGHRLFSDADGDGTGGYDSASLTWDAMYLPGSMTVVQSVAQATISPSRYATIRWGCRDSAGLVHAFEEANKNVQGVQTTGDYLTAYGASNGTLFASTCTDFAGNEMAYVEIWDSTGSATGTNLMDAWYSAGMLSGPYRTSTTVTCRNDAGVDTVMTAVTESESATSNIVTTIPACPTGSRTSKVAVGLKPGDGSTATGTIPAWTWTAKESDLNVAYPLCKASAGCELVIKYNGTDCELGATQCIDWYTDSKTVGGYACSWGPYTLAKSQCDPLRYAYDPGAVFDPNGNRVYKPGYSTGTDLTTPATNPSTATTTTTTADPGTSYSFPTTAPIPSSPSVVPDTGVQVDSGCWPTGTAAWNPLEWVLRPVQCALVWAFVPPEGMGTRMAEFSTAWDGSDAGTWVSTITDPVGDVSAAWSSGGSGCGGPEWTLSMSAFGGGSYPFRPFDSCREPLASVAPVVKGVGVALVFVIGFRAAANPVLGALGLPRIPGRRQLWQHEIHGD